MDSNTGGGKRRGRKGETGTEQEHTETLRSQLCAAWSMAKWESSPGMSWGVNSLRLQKYYKKSVWSLHDFVQYLFSLDS